MIPDSKQDRFKIIKNYIFDKWIFNGMMLLIVLVLYSIFYFNDYNLDYVSCKVNTSEEPIRFFNFSLNISTPQNDTVYKYKIQKDVNFKDGMCRNPAYVPTSWKNEEYLKPGEYGKEHLEWIDFFYRFFISIIIIALFFNHLIHNIKRVKL
jgi:hypothetical protein